MSFLFFFILLEVVLSSHFAWWAWLLWFLFSFANFLRITKSFKKIFLALLLLFWFFALSHLYSSSFLLSFLFLLSNFYHFNSLQPLSRFPDGIFYNNFPQKLLYPNILLFYILEVADPNR